VTVGVSASTHPVNGGKRAWLWILFGCGALAWFWYATGGSASRQRPSAPAVVAEEEPAPPPPASVEASRPLPVAARPAATPSVTPAPSVTGSRDNGRPPCTNDEQCKGPRHAECIDTKCVQGKCVYDESHCECVSNDDCEDDDPCTRNHCFSSTQKCIYIPIDDCKR
jgi:hypothetical protein